MQRLLAMTHSAGKRAPRHLAALLGSVLVACGPADNEPAGQMPAPTSAETGLFAETTITAVGDSTAHGRLRLNQDRQFLWINGLLAGLQPGLYLLHIHEEKECAATPNGFAGSVFSPDQGSTDQMSDTDLNNAAGNLGEFAADDNGNATIDVVESNLSLGNGSRSVLNRSIVVHRADEEHSNSADLLAGEAVACGAIEATLTPEYVR